MKYLMFALDDFPLAIAVDPAATDNERRAPLERANENLENL